MSSANYSDFITGDIIRFTIVKNEAFSGLIMSPVSEKFFKKSERL